MEGKFCVIIGIMVILACLSHCRDFYMGMFQKNDRLVVQDRLYKERVPFRKMTAKYLKVVRCPISYLRVVDRLGVGNGPHVRIVRGGLRKNHVYLYISSAYNLPLSVAIYIGCPKFPVTTTRTTAAKESINGDTTTPDDSITDTSADANATTSSSGNGTASGNATTTNETTTISTTP